MSKIPLWMNLISGLLLGYDLFPKSGGWKRFHDGIRQKIEMINTNDPSSKGMIIFNAFVSFFVFLMIFCWAYYKSRNTPDKDTLTEILAYFIGSLIGFSIFFIVTRITKKTEIILAFGWGLSMVAFILAATLHAPNNIFAGFLALCYILFLFPIAILVAKQVQGFLIKHPEKDYYMFAVLGLLLFIVSNIIQIFA